MIKIKYILKIKDNINLDDLKKYGFKKQCRIDYGKKTEDIIYRNDNENINIFPDNKAKYLQDYELIPRVLYMMNEDTSYQESPEFEFPGILYDLIKDDIVEKLEIKEDCWWLDE